MCREVPTPILSNKCQTRLKKIKLSIQKNLFPFKIGIVLFNIFFTGTEIWIGREGAIRVAYLGQE